MIIYLVSQNHVSKYLGGNETYTDSLALNYINLGHQVNYFSANFDSKKTQYQLNTIFSLIYHLSFSRTRSQSNPIIHLTGTSIYFPLISILGLIKHIPVIWTFQAPTNHPNPIIKGLSNYYEWLMTKLVSSTIVTSNASETYLNKINRRAAYHYLPLSLPYPIQPFSSTKTDLRNQLHMDNQIYYVIAVSKLDSHHYYKGINVLLAALTSLPHNYHAIIVGGGKLISYYQDMARKLKVDKRLVFTNEISEVQKLKYLQASDVFVLPSTSSSEGFGISTLEAIAVGTKAIITNCIGAADYFQINNLATIIPPNNPKILAAKIEIACKFNQTSKPGVKIDLNLISPQQTVRATLDTYQAILNSRKQMNRVLFLNENPLPNIYSSGTIAAKELRLRSAINEIDQIHVISLPGKSVQTDDFKVTQLEQKIIIHPTINFPYYFSSIILFIYGLVYAISLKPITIEAESPLFSGLAATLIGKILGIKTIVEIRSSFIELAKIKLTYIPLKIKQAVIDLIENFVFKHATVIIANSHHYHEMLKLRGIDSIVINPGVQFVIPSKLLPKHKIIGFIGRLVPEKGVEFLINSVFTLKDLLIKNQYQVKIVGEGPHSSSLKSLVDRLQLNQIIEFCGSQPAKEMLSKFQILINPCYVKPPLEMINAEAAAMGVPVIGFGQNGLPETIAPNISGIVVPYFNQNLLTTTIKSLITNPKEIIKLASTSQKFAIKNYNFNTQVKLLKNIYHNLKLF